MKLYSIMVGAILWLILDNIGDNGDKFYIILKGEVSV